MFHSNTLTLRRFSEKGAPKLVEGAHLNENHQEDKKLQ